MKTAIIPFTLSFSLLLTACDTSEPLTGVAGDADTSGEIAPDDEDDPVRPLPGDADSCPMPEVDPLDTVVRSVFVDDEPGGFGRRTIRLLDAADVVVAELEFEIDADGQVTVLASFEHDGSSAAFRTVAVYDDDGNLGHELEFLNQDEQSIEKFARLQQKVVELGLVGIDGQAVPTDGCGWGAVGATGTCLLCGACAGATWGACAEVCGLACLGAVWAATCACTDGEVGCG